MAKRVLLLLPAGFEVMEASCFTETIGWADIYGDEPFEQLSVGLRSPLRTTFGFSVNPEALLDEVDLDRFDALAMPGGFADAGYYDDALSEPVLQVIRSFAARNAPIAAVCVASLALGAAGVLKGRQATTYHQPGGKRKAELESYGARFLDEPVVVDGPFISSTGPGTAIEVALELVAALSTPAFADDLRARMRVPTPDLAWRRAPQVINADN